MAFSKLPRVLITEEVSQKKCPGPGDYDPRDAQQNVIGGNIAPKYRRTSLASLSEKPNYLRRKDTSDIRRKLDATVIISKGRLQQMTIQIDSLKEDNDLLMKKVDTISVECDRKSEEIGKTVKKLEESSSRVGELETSQKSLKENILGKEKEISILRAQGDSLETDVVALESKLKSLNLESECMTVESARLTADLATKSVCLQEIEAQLIDLQYSSTILEEKLVTSSAERNITAQKCVDLELEISEAKVDLETSRKALLEVESSKNETINRLRGKLASIHVAKETQKCKFETQVAKLGTERIQIEQEHQCEVQTLQSQLETMSRKFYNEHDKYLKEITILRKELDEITGHFEHSKQDREILIAQVKAGEAYESQVNQLLEENAQLQLNVLAEREQVKNLVETQINYEDELEEHFEELIHKVEELSEAKANVEKLELSRNNLSAELKHSQEQNDIAEKELQSTLDIVKKVKSKQQFGEVLMKDGNNERYQRLKASAKKQEEVFYEKMDQLQRQKDDDITRYKQIIADRDRLLQLRVDEIDRMKIKAEKEKNHMESELVFLNEKVSIIDEFNAEKSVLVEQNENLAKSLNETERKLAGKMGHSNHLQKIKYIDRLRDENCMYRERHDELECQIKKLNARIKVLEREPVAGSDLHFFRD